MINHATIAQRTSPTLAVVESGAEREGPHVHPIPMARLHPANRIPMGQFAPSLIQHLQAALSLDELLQITAADLRQTLNCALVLIGQQSSTGQTEIKAVADRHAMTLPSGSSSPVLKASVCRPYSHSSRVQLMAPRTLTQFPGKLQRQLQIQAMCHGLIVPITYETAPWGYIMGFRHHPTDFWPANTVFFFEQVAKQLEVAFQLSHLQQQVQVEQQRRQQSEAFLQHIQLHDPLTGLPNRKHLLQTLSQILETPGCAAQSVAVLLLHLNRFQIINDSLGHRLGDQLLLEVSQRLQALLAPGMQLAHWGENEFAVLLPHLTSSTMALEMAQTLHRALDQPFILDQTEVVLTACIGLAVNQAADMPPETLLRNADTALHQAKDCKQSPILSFQSVMHDQTLARLQLEAGLRKALIQEELILHYQPIVTLPEGKLIGFEALVRWQHPTLGLVSPADFIPLAEETGLIVPLDQWCLQTACEQMQQWRQQFPQLQPLTISVNLSSQNFSQPHLAQRVEAILTSTQLPSSHLKLEITESTLIENTELASQILSDLRQLGIHISMDDFGTGYSSLSYLHKFKIGTLKIDQSFVSELQPNTDKAAIVQAIITLAKALGMNIVAEGIETPQQIELLTAMGCQSGQGYLFSRPIDAVAATQLLTA